MENQEQEHIQFLNVRKAYLPKEQFVLAYAVQDGYTVSPNDCIILSKCPWKIAHVFNSNRWTAAIRQHNGTYKVDVTMPFLKNKKDRTTEYQFIYLTAECKVEGASQIFRLSEIVEMQEHELVDMHEKLQPEKSLFDSKFWTSNEWRELPFTIKSLRSNQTTDLKQKPLNLTQSEYQAKVSNLYETIHSVNRLITQYEEIHMSTVEKCVKLEQEVIINEHQTQQQIKVGEIMQEMQKLSVPELEERQHQLKVEQTTLLSYKNDLEMMLSHEGFTKVIDTTGSVHELKTEHDSLSKTLDLRKWCVPENRDAEIELTKVANKEIIEKLQAECSDLQQKLQELENQHKRCVVATCQDLAELRKEQETEVRQDEEMIEKLEKEIKNLQSKVTEPHPQPLREIEHLKSELKARDHLIETLQYESERSLDVNANEALVAHIKYLEDLLTSKEAELKSLFEAAEEETVTFPHIDSRHLLALRPKRGKSARSKRRKVKKQGTNTTQIETVDAGQQPSLIKADKATSAVNREDFSSLTSRLTQRIIQPVQKSKSDATHTDTLSSKEAKNTTASERGLSATLSENQENWIKLLRLLLRPRTYQLSIEAPPTLKAITQSTAVSVESLNKALWKLYEHQTDSVSQTLSDREFVDHLFDSQTSLDRSVPSTPCNSINSLDGVRNLPKSSLSSQSYNLQQALQNLFSVSDEDLRTVLPYAPAESISSLGEVMRHLFNTTSKKHSTTNAMSSESLAASLEWLFRNLSDTEVGRDGKGSSDESLTLWNLLEREPAEYEGLDVKEINLNKHGHTTPAVEDRVFGPCDNVKEKVNPSLHEIIRESSPDRGADIAHPRKSSPRRSKIPLPIIPSSKTQTEEDDTKIEERNSEEEVITITLSLENRPLMLHQLEHVSTRQLARVRAYNRQLGGKNRLLRNKNAKKFSSLQNHVKPKKIIRACPECAKVFSCSNMAHVKHRLQQHQQSVHQTQPGKPDSD